MMGGIYEKVTGLGGLMELLRGDLKGGLTGLGLYGMKKIMDSQLAKTHVAQWLNNLSKSDLVEAVGKFPQLKSLIRMAKQSGQQQKQP